LCDYFCGIYLRNCYMRIAHIAFMLHVPPIHYSFIRSSYHVLYYGATAPSGPGRPHYRGFTITLGNSPLDEWSARRRELYLTTHKTLTRDRHPRSERDFEPTVLARERPQTHAWNRAATVSGIRSCTDVKKITGLLAVQYLTTPISSFPPDCRYFPSSVWSRKPSGLICCTGTVTFYSNVVQCFFIIKPTRCTNFTNLFWHEILHVSDSSSVHHQEFIHCTLSNGICHTCL